MPSQRKLLAGLARPRDIPLKRQPLESACGWGTDWNGVMAGVNSGLLASLVRLVAVMVI